MKDLLTGEQMLFTELQNFAASKSYRILKFGKLVGSLIKMDAKIEFSDVLRIFELLLHLQSNLAEIWNIAFTDKGKKSDAFFFLMLSTFDFISILQEKILENCDFLCFPTFFHVKLV